ncbi:MAG: hypothetical protein ACLFWL_16495 [Candidatus Brocadiia bacterium]
MRITWLVVVCIVLVPLAQAGTKGANNHFDDLDSLQEHLRVSFLTTLEKKEFPDLDPVVSQMKRLVKGDASKEDIKKIRQHAEKLLKEEAESWKVSNIGAILYFFEEDLTLWRKYTKKTEKLPYELLDYLTRQDGTIRKGVARDLDVRNLTDYIAYGIALRVSRRLERFYCQGRRSLVPSDLRYAQLLANLPQSPQRDRVLLNYPFEHQSLVWRTCAEREKVVEVVSNWPEDTWRPPKNIFKWYYCNVIQEAGLEREFMKQLELRNMTDVIPDKLKPKDTREQN